MRIELGFPPEPGATFPRGLPAIVGALDDPLALVFGQSAEEGDEPLADGCREIPSVVCRAP